jgi:hypothetical protein
MNSSRFFTVAAASLLATSVFAAPTVTNTTQFGSGFAVSNTDLLQTNLASVTSSGNFNREGAIGLSALTDGIFGGQGNQRNGGHAATADGSNIATFFFDGGLGAGYNISAVDTYAGWDNYRGGQDYVLSYATAAAPSTYTVLASVFNNARAGGNTNTHANIVDSSGFLATKVQSLRFEFGSNLTYGYAGYRQIDVQGVAAVPEPGTYALMLAGFAAMGFVARRRRSN